MLSAGNFRNLTVDDPLLDWLERFGEARGFLRDDMAPDYDPRLDLGQFLKQKGSEFEQKVIDCIRGRATVVEIRRAPHAEALEETRRAIETKAEVIYQGALLDNEHDIFGRPDLLIRTDAMYKLVDTPQHLLHEPTGAPYAVCDIKYSTHALDKHGMIKNGKDDVSRKMQLYVYNRALAQITGIEAQLAYLIGRTWKNSKERGDGCLERLCPADMFDDKLAELLAAGMEWLRKLEQYGAEWELFPAPSVPELYPNMGNPKDAPWHKAKKEIAKELAELTLLWYVSPAGRKRAHADGIYRHDDPLCRADLFGLSAERSETLQAIIETNKGEQLVRPGRIQCDREKWHEPAPIEFYVDFETVSDLDDDFSAFPNKGGSPFIFMAGCGYVENGEWRFRAFTADRLDLDSEAKALDEWIAYMHSLSEEKGCAEPLVFHWSHAEKSFMVSSYNSAQERHGGKFPDIRWYDFLNVVRGEPVTVKGAYAFGLKAFAQAFKSHGLTETLWQDGVADGMAAMAGAWYCHREAVERGCSMRELEFMRKIEEYNEVDCKVMMEIIAYLRANH